MTQLDHVDVISTGELLDGRYRLQQRIGEGGAARVYRAEDTLLGRTVAVKLLRGALDGLGTPERAQSETAVLASLNHHGLVTLFDARVSEAEGSYLVMEYVEGITLQEWIERGRIEPAEAASLAIDIAEALHVAHLAGVVHRDIKPSNILLSKSPVPGQGWRAKIADFGIAHLLDSVRVTTPGLMVGTVAYIAPEQARGAAPAPPADVYALGIVLLEALTGVRPFADAEGIGTVMARLKDPPPIPDSLDERWRQLLRGMTAILPEDRPTAIEVAVAASRLATADGVAFTPLGELPEVTAVQARPDSTGETAVLPRSADILDVPVVPPTSPVPDGAEPGGRRRPGMILASIVVGVLLVAGIVGAAIWSTAPTVGVPEPAPSTSVPLKVVEPSATPTPADPGVAPADDTSGSVNTGTGTTNPNSGPGNSNKGGNGKGKEKGKSGKG